MISAYVSLVVWFWCVDMAAGVAADVTPRPFAALILALIWPLSVAFALIASALIIDRLRNPPEATP